MNRRIPFAAAALLAALSGPSCRLLHRSAKTKAPPTPPPAAEPIPAPSVPRQPSDRQVALPAPPNLPPGQPTLTAPAASTEPGKLPPPPRRRRRVPPSETASTPAVPAVPVEPAPAPSAVPQLQQMLTAEQQQAYNEEIDRKIDRVQKTVAVLATHKLNDEQATYLDRIRTFIKQAGDARKTDLFRARNLAERASVLAEDLLRSVQ
jgi:hypothetical protein